VKYYLVNLLFLNFIIDLPVQLQFCIFSDDAALINDVFKDIAAWCGRVVPMFLRPSIFKGISIDFDLFVTSTDMLLRMETIVSQKRRDNSPTPGGDILEDVVDSSICRSLPTY
jgi:hypothetical protein